MQFDFSRVKGEDPFKKNDWVADRSVQLDIDRPSTPNISLPQPSISNSTISQYNPSLLQKVGSFFRDLKTGILPGVEKSIIGGTVSKLGDQVMQKSYENAQNRGKFVGEIPQFKSTPFVPQNAAQGIGEFIGSNIADAPLWMIGEGAVSPITTKLTTSLAPKIAPKALPYVESSLKGALSAPLISSAQSLVNGDNLNQSLSRMGENVALGAIGGPAFMGVGKAFNKGVQFVKGEGIKIPKIDNLSGRNQPTPITPNPLGSEPFGGSAIPKAEPIPTVTPRPAGVPTPQMAISAPKIEPKPLEIGKVEIPQTQQPKLNTIPGKMEPLGNGQNARSFPNTTFNSTLADNELKSRLATETQPSGRGAYDPITLKGVDEEAQRLINENPDVARNFVLNEKEPSALHTATGVRLIKHYQDTGDYDRAVDVSMSLAEKLTKQGQAISAARLMSALNPDGVLVFASRQIQKINNVPKLKINKFGIGKDVTLEPETAQNLKKLAEIMQNAPDDATRIEASQNLQEALNALKPSGIGQKLSTTQTIAQLYNLKTNDRNVLSNEMFYALERANKYVAAPIDWAKSKLTGSERTVTFRTGGGNLWQNFLQGYKDYGNALVKGAKAGWRGVNPEGVTTQYELGHGLTFNKDGNIAERTASFFERSLGAALKGFDYAAFTRAKNQTIGEMAVLRSLNETGKVDKALVQKYMQNADENILNIADHYGKYITFQDDNLISRGLSVVKRGLNLGQDFGLGDFVLKYPRTPGALISRGLDYSPAGFLRSAYLMSSPILKGKAADSREVTLALSRAITGTLGVTGMGYFLADKGVITGSADKDKDIRNLQQQTGEGAYRVNVSALVRLVKSGFNPDSATKQAGDTMISYDWMQPIAMAISSGANINKSVKEKLNSKEVVSGAMAAAAGSVEGAINTIAEQPVLKGIQQLVQGNNGASSIGSNLAYVAKGIPSSFTPTLLNQFRQYGDNTARSSYNQNPAIESLNGLKLKIPGLAKSLPQTYDTLGNPKENFQNGSNTFGNVFLNPSFVSKYAPSPEADKILNVYNKTGSTSQIPRVVKPEITTSDGKKFSLTPQEYSDYQRLVGEETKRGINGIDKNLSPQNQLKEMLSILNNADAVGKRIILERRGLGVDRKGNTLSIKK